MISIFSLGNRKKAGIYLSSVIDKNIIVVLSVVCPTKYLN